MTKSCRVNELKKGKNYMEVVLSVSNCSERQIAKNNSPFVKFTGVDELGNEIDVCVFDDEAIDKLKLVGDKKASRVKIFNPYVNPKECIITVNQRDILKIKPISFEETSQYDHPQIHSQESNQIVQSQPEFPSVYEYYEQGQRVFHSQPSQEKHNHAKNKSISLPSDDDEVALEEPSQEKHNHTKNKPIFLSSDDDEVALEEENPIVNQHNEPLQCRLVVSENTSCLDSSQVNQKMEASEDKEFQRIVQEFEQFVQSLDYHYGCDDTQQNTDQRNNIMRTRVSHDQLPPRNEDVNCSNESQGILIVPERSAKQSVIKSFDYQRIFMEIVSKKFPERDSSLLTSSILNERRCPTLKTLKRMTKKDGIQRTAGFQRKSRKRPVDPEAPQAEVHFEQTTRRRRQAGQPLSEATMEVHFEQTTRRRRQAGQPLSEATTDVHSEQTTRRRRQDGQPLSEATMEVHSEQTTRRRRQAGQPLSEATTDVHSEQTTRRRRQDGQPLSDQRDIASVKEQSPTQASNYDDLENGPKNSHVDRPSTISQPLSQEPLLGPESTEECSQNPRQNEDDQHDASDQPVVQDETEENATQEDDQRDASDQPVYMSVSEAVAKFLKDDRKILTKPSSRSRQRWNQQTTREQKKKHFTLCMIQRARRDLINARQGQAMYKGRLHCGYLQNVIETLVRTEYLDFI